MNKYLELFAGSTNPTPSANAGYPWVVYKKQA